MGRYFQYILFLSIIGIYSTCKRVETKSDTGLAYFPLTVGSIKIFAIDSVNYNAITNKKDSVRYYVKEILSEEKLDSNGYRIIKAEYYSSMDTAKGWVYSSYLFYKKNEYHITIDQGGPILTCFVFPVIKGRKWNINAFNHLDPENASYTFVAKSWMNYNDCVEVFVKEDINVIEETIDKRIYCREKGLVYKILSQITIDKSKKNGYRIITNLIK